MTLTKNRISGIIGIIIGVGYLFMTYTMPDPAIGDPLGPKLFPLIMGYGSLLCGLALIIRDMGIKKTAKGQVVSFNIAENRELYIKIGLTIILGIIYGFALDPIGYVISTFVFVLGIMSIINNLRRMVENLLVSAGFSVVTYYVFSILLKLSLPRGLLKF